MANNSVVTQDTLQTFYDNKVYPYLNGATHTGCVPLGTVLPYYGETAPEHFLICDGTEYLKSDYGELATHLLSLTDPTPYQGSDADHFKVPDLRGEFLRGSGTNSHTNQGSGGDVGEHQDATKIPRMQLDANYISGVFNNQSITIPMDADGEYGSGTSWRGGNSSGTFESTNTHVMTRPTNTSVLYCIAYQNAYIDLALDGFPIDITQPQDGQLLMYDATAGRWVNGGHKYSTDEHIVGTWIDGKPVYEKTIEISIPTTVGLIDVAHNINSFNKLICAIGIIYEQNGNTGYSVPYKDNSNEIRVQVNESVIRYAKNGTDFNNGSLYITIQYTKTTD